jgi:hypothetical protein
LTIDPTECTELIELIESTDDLRPLGGNPGGLERMNFRSCACSQMCIGVVLTMTGAELGDDVGGGGELVAMGDFFVDTIAGGLANRRC